MCADESFRLLDTPRGRTEVNPHVKHNLDATVGDLVRDLLQLWIASIDTTEPTLDQSRAVLDEQFPRALISARGNLHELCSEAEYTY